jgi:hypothetical protein
MFEWLLDEMATIKTNKFYVIDGPLPAETRKAMEDANIAVPPSYKAFVLRFGNVNLYRKGSVYLVRVFAAPRYDVSKDGQHLLFFGRTDYALAYLKESLLVPSGESPVFEWRHAQGLRRAAVGFEEWLIKKCEAARKRFTKKEWEDIRTGPRPFNEQERIVVEARRRFRLRVAGVAENEDLVFEVHNASGMVLPYLSVGVRDKCGEIIGGIWLPVSSVLPGETCIIQKGCYKERHKPEEIEVFLQPDPEPEDRDLYWEFKQIGNQ